MENSRSICTGVQNQFNHQVATGWIENEYDVCILAGLTVSHKYDNPNKLKSAFDLTRDFALIGACLHAEIYETANQDWKSNFNNFIKKINISQTKS